MEPATTRYGVGAATLSYRSGMLGSVSNGDGGE